MILMLQLPPLIKLSYRSTPSYFHVRPIDEVIMPPSKGAMQGNPLAYNMALPCSTCITPCIEQLPCPVQSHIFFVLASCAGA
jgi:hypothetical protein